MYVPTGDDLKFKKFMLRWWCWQTRKKTKSWMKCLPPLSTHPGIDSMVHWTTNML